MATRIRGSLTLEYRSVKTFTDQVRQARPWTQARVAAVATHYEAPSAATGDAAAVVPLDRAVRFEAMTIMAQPIESMGSQRWTRHQQLRFLALLLEAGHNGLLNSSKSTILKSTLEGFPRLETDFPQRRWTVKMLDNKYRELLKYWRVFKEAERPSGATYNPETGRIAMNKANGMR